MSGLCIYCGKAPTTRKGDHVPPQSFFPEKRGHPLIQVPCCRPCNEAFSRDDGRVRNLLSCIENTESHSAFEELRAKRNASLVRRMSNGKTTDSDLRHLLESSRLKPRFSEEGLYLGEQPALSFDQPVVKRFFERLTKALHHHAYGTGYIPCEVLSSNVIDDKKQQIFETYAPTSHGVLGDDAFFYADFSPDPTEFSLWFFRFYGGAEFWSVLRPIEKDAPV